MRGNYRKDGGFSLIELLVVIALIGVLSTIALMSFAGTRTKARDAKRKADLHQVQTALGVFYDSRGTYPTSTAVWNAGAADYGAASSTGAASYNAIAPYISDNVAILPTDPLNTTNDPLVNDTYMYRYVSNDGKSFAIVFETENPDDDSPYVIIGW
jgi:prepilin-type N-terminal cleavage/methylation domain-containing protein